MICKEKWCVGELWVFKFQRHRIDKSIIIIANMKNVNLTEQCLEAEIKANIENIESFYGLSSVDSLKELVKIILDPKKSQNFFKEKNVTISSMFENVKDRSESLDLKKIEVFAQKYSYERLVEKFTKPRTAKNEMLLGILEKKMSKEVISSHHTRKNIWMLASGAKFSMNMHRGQYQNLITYPNYPTYFMRSIKQDINRTVNKNTSLSTEEDLISLQNVLIAFSRRNPYVGYCQGLNFIAYFLIVMQFTEEEAFWLLSQIIETIIPMDYYTNMIGVVCDQQIFISILRNIHPKIVRKFDDVGLDPSVLSIEWFVCLFTSSLPFYLVKVVWDRLLVEGTRAFIKTGIIILKYFQEEILQVTQFHEIIMILEQNTKKLSVPQASFNQEFEKIYINKQGLMITRNLYREYHLKQKLSEKMSNQKRRAEEKLQCNCRWPICVTNLEKNRRERSEIDVWIFRQEGQPHLIHDYLPSIKKDTGQKKKDEKDKKDKKGEKSEKINKSNQKLIPQKFMDFIYPKNGQANSNESQLTDQQYRTESKSSATSPNQTIEKQNSNILSPICNQIEYQHLTIGRMQHICVRKQGVDMREGKLLFKGAAKRLSMILQDEQEVNSEKKAQNLLKIIQISEFQGQEEKLNETLKSDEEHEVMKKSQTIRFYSKFIQNNKEISQIIGPGKANQFIDS